MMQLRLPLTLVSLGGGDSVEGVECMTQRVEGGGWGQGDGGWGHWGVEGGEVERWRVEGGGADGVGCRGKGVLTALFRVAW